ncbi:hypothetical protein JZX87_22980 [Agrobacterium sp. Ap1]|jgi:hypothetical protein|uniref:hypothetical protein n=1 Tax=Rhizobium/Agrobacterium group TaxID=227290 RepID=UPI000F95A32F|nr:hypothetical protein [Agrobacterium sp. Ap1]MBO0144024.1 hypothetical protein [Agrobacterium sp. Ap1]
MAVAQLVLSIIKFEAAVMSCDFQSQELDAGQGYTFASTSKKYLIITALVDIYVAFSSGAAAPNAAVTPRI